MPEAVKEGVSSGDVVVPEETAPPPVDLATDGAVEVKPPPTTEPSLPVEEVQETGDCAMEEVGETAPELVEPPTEQSVDKKTDLSPGTEALVQTESDIKHQINEMIAEGRALLTIKRDSYAAAEVLSKACEKSTEIYGELSEHCGELYFLYGSSMLECGKTENTVLGENIKDKDAEEDADEGDDDDDADEDGEENKTEAMEVNESEEGSSTVGTSNGSVVKDSEAGDDVTKEEEEEDSCLKVAWEMFELAKVAYKRLQKEEKLAETLMKLGEVGIESGHPSAMDDMIAALEIRQKLFPNQRIIPETHFNIGLGYSMFEMFTEAITHFEKSKDLLEQIALNLENVGDEPSLKEAKEIRGVLPDLSEKIQDMIDSKIEKTKEVEEVIKKGLSSTSKENGVSPKCLESNQPPSNITHLIKRKRKIEEVTSDLPSKAVEEQRRKVKVLDKEEESLTDVSSTTPCIPINESKESCSAVVVEPMETEESTEPTSSEVLAEVTSPTIADQLQSDQPIKTPITDVKSDDTSAPSIEKVETDILPPADVVLSEVNMEDTSVPDKLESDQNLRSKEKSVDCKDEKEDCEKKVEGNQSPLEEQNVEIVTDEKLETSSEKLLQTPIMEEDNSISTTSEVLDQEKATTHLNKGSCEIVESESNMEESKIASDEEKCASNEKKDIEQKELKEAMDTDESVIETKIPVENNEISNSKDISESCVLPDSVVSDNKIESQQSTETAATSTTDVPESKESQNKMEIENVPTSPANKFDAPIIEHEEKNSIPPVTETLESKDKHSKEPAKDKMENPTASDKLDSSLSQENIVTCKEEDNGKKVEDNKTLETKALESTSGELLDAKIIESVSEETNNLETNDSDVTHKSSEKESLHTSEINNVTNGCVEEESQNTVTKEIAKKENEECTNDKE